MIEWVIAAHAAAAIAESNSNLRQMEAADTPEKKGALFRVWAERDQRRHELAVARASAPVVNITNKTYVW